MVLAPGRISEPLLEPFENRRAGPQPWRCCLLAEPGLVRFSRFPGRFLCVACYKCGCNHGRPLPPPPAQLVSLKSSFLFLRAKLHGACSPPEGEHRARGAGSRLASRQRPGELHPHPELTYALPFLFFVFGFLLSVVASKDRTVLLQDIDLLQLVIHSLETTSSLYILCASVPSRL